MVYVIPKKAVVLMVGPTGAGKSTFSHDHFPSSEILSADAIREELTGDSRDISKDFVVWKIFNRRLKERLARGERVICDNTNLLARDRKNILQEIPDGYSIFYLVVNRPREEIYQTDTWRSEVMVKGKTLIDHTCDRFNAVKKRVMTGDEVAQVVVALKDEIRVE